jgi:aspartate aminotransferase
MVNKEATRTSLFVMQVFGGWSFPNALLQYSLEDLERLSIDIKVLQARRDRLISTLTEIGYNTTTPEGTFYMMVRSPIDDDMAFTELLSKHGILCLPGTLLEMPGWIRLSLTASDETVGRSQTGFASAYREAKL